MTVALMKSPIYIMMVGFSLSGKTTVAKEIEKKLSNPKIRLDTSNIHDFLNSYPLFQDGNTIKGKAFDLRQNTTKAIKQAFLKELARTRVNIIDDSANLSQKERQAKISIIKKANPHYKFRYVVVDIGEVELLKRLRKFDEANIRRGFKPTWQDLYLKVQKDKYEPVASKEGVTLKVSGSGQSKIDWTKVLHSESH